MGWLGRVFRREPSGEEPAEAEPHGRRADIRWDADIGVPELGEPVYARARVLESVLGDTVVTYHSIVTADIEVPGSEPYRVRLRSGTDPDGLNGLVLGRHVPVIVDAADLERVIVIEPPCGPDLPLVPDDLQKIRDARDMRTAALAEKYPPPSAHQMELRLRPTASAAHPYWDAVCWRLGLLTTIEVREIIDRIRADGNAWDSATAELYSCGPLLPDDLRRRVGDYVMHVQRVAPAISYAEEQVLWTLGVAALMRDLGSDEVDDAVYERVMRPFVEVCGPLPEERT